MVQKMPSSTRNKGSLLDLQDTAEDLWRLKTPSRPQNVRVGLTKYWNQGHRLELWNRPLRRTFEETAKEELEQRDWGF
jgi:hypothetical protein